jgi:CheY-like chemotaxis protein
MKPPRYGTGPGLRIVVADDNADLRELLRTVLESAGHVVRLAANGREALRLQAKEAADVLITDLFMPESDGFEAIDGFRNSFPQTRIVVISGDARMTKRNYLPAASLVGADATLSKPIDCERLLETLRNLPPREASCSA